MKLKFDYILLFMILLWGCTARQLGTTEMAPEPFVNQLVEASSPYLLRQMNQPVKWQNWGETALEQAKREERLLLISIGFSASIWCQRMEEEIFSDTIVAELINTYFIPVKVDREERPDVDIHYLDLCEQLSGQDCTWPLQVIALPDGRPIAWSSFMEKEEWLAWLSAYIQQYRDEPQVLEGTANTYESKIEDQLASASHHQSTESIQTQNLITLGQFLASSLSQSSGISVGRQFLPSPVLLEYVLAFEASELSQHQPVLFEQLDKMAFSAMYDHVGGGFFRVARDERWRAPEFEKMLYDNAQLVKLYAQAYQITQNPLYEEVVYETLACLSREMRSSEGGYYASLNALSEGEEGRYYTWSIRDLEVALGGRTELISRYYNLTLEGNIWQGQNIFYRKFADEALAGAYRMRRFELREEIAQAKFILLREREKRVLPAREKKQITAWNALMVSALATAARAFDEPEWKREAGQLAEFLATQLLQADGSLARYLHDGQAEGIGFLDDYALSIQAFLDVYELSFEERWIEMAEELLIYVLTNFQQDENEQYLYAPVYTETPAALKAQVKDRALPSSNAVLCDIMLRLGTLLDKSNYQQQAKKRLLDMWPKVQEEPLAYAKWSQLALHWKLPSYQVVIVGLDSELLRRELSQYYLPEVQLIGGSSASTTLPLLQNKEIPEQSLIYVCQDGNCQEPVSTVSEALSLMQMDKK